MRTSVLVVVIGTVMLAACGPPAATMDDLDTRLVTLPGGARIRAEVMFRPQDLVRGMMFRDSLAPDRGMLFLHQAPGNYAYWMYQVKIPLDIIWMDRNRAIVEISANTPPCPSKSARQCPNFGGREPSMFVLELAGGMAQKYGLRVGQTLTF